MLQNVYLSIKKTKYDKIKMSPRISSSNLGPFGEKGGGFFTEKSNGRWVLGDKRGEMHRCARDAQIVHLLCSENWLNFMTTTPSLNF
jgi:hypothetical protein